LQAEQSENDSVNEPVRRRFPPGLRQQIQRGEVLEYAHRISRAKHRDRAGEPDVFWSGLLPPRGSRLARNRGYSAMMFPDSKNIQAHLDRRVQSVRPE